MRQHDGVGFGVGQVEAAAQRVAQLVVKGHTDTAEHRAAQPCAVQALRSGLQVGGIAEHGGNARSERTNAFLGHQRHHGVGIACVEPLGGMRNGIQATGYGQATRQPDRQRRVVDDSARQNARIAASSFRTGLGQSVNRRDFGAGVSRRMATIGIPVSRAMALPSPVVEPPPNATAQSAPASRARAVASRALSTGTCMTAPGYTPADSGPRRSAMRRASACWFGVQSTRHVWPQVVPPRPQPGSKCRRQTRREPRGPHRQIAVTISWLHQWALARGQG